MSRIYVKQAHVGSKRGVLEGVAYTYLYIYIQNMYVYMYVCMHLRTYIHTCIFRMLQRESSLGVTVMTGSQPGSD